MQLWCTALYGHLKNDLKLPSHELGLFFVCVCVCIRSAIQCWKCVCRTVCAHSTPERGIMLEMSVSECAWWLMECVWEWLILAMSSYTFTIPSARHHEVQEGNWDGMSLCKCVCEFKSEHFYNFDWRKWGKGRGPLWWLFWHFVQVCWISVCVAWMYLCTACVCVTTAACVHTTVGETSCRARQRSRRQRTLLTPLRVCVWAHICECVCARMCVLTGFTIRQSILSSPRNSWTGWDPEKRQTTNKILVLCSHTVSQALIRFILWRWDIKRNEVIMSDGNNTPKQMAYARNIF